MTKVTTKITNKKTSPINLALPMKYSMSTKNRSIDPGKSIQLDFDIWSKLSQTNRLRLEKLVRTNQIAISTQVWTEDAKIVTISSNNKVSIDDAPKPETNKEQSNTKQVSSKDPTKKIDPTFRTSQDRNVIKGYKVVEGSDAITKMGFSPATREQNFDHSKALGNNNDTKGFAQISKAGVSNLVNKTPQDNVKVDAPGLFKNGTSITDTVVNKSGQTGQQQVQDAVNTDTEAQLTKLETDQPTAPTVLIDQMLKAGDLDKLKAYLTELYPQIKFTKKALKDCKTSQDIKLKFGLDDLL